MGLDEPAIHANVERRTGDVGTDIDGQLDDVLLRVAYKGAEQLDGVFQGLLEQLERIGVATVRDGGERVKDTGQ